MTNRTITLASTQTEELFISLGTVKTHLSSLQDKIGARNRVELAAFAWQSGRMRD